MRISDWSSDVCSSDLPAARRRADRDRLHLGHRRGHVGDRRERRDALDRVVARDDRGQPEIGIGGDGRDMLEIGRASCRERVCQYVSISVVAVSLKKKHHETTKNLTNVEARHAKSAIWSQQRTRTT